jgi:hypothetical protein
MLFFASSVARMRPYRNLAGALAKLLKLSRAEVDLEHAVPELTRASRNGELMEDAILDVVATWPGGCVHAWVDVTIRCPYAARYPNTHRIAGVCRSIGCAGQTQALRRVGPASCVRNRWAS